MSNTVQISVTNKMSDDTVANNAFDMKLATDRPVMTAGTVSLPPLDVIENISPSDNTNGGAYTGTASHGFAVRGVVGYILPGAKATLVIYFDSTKCRVDAVSPGVIITTDTIDSVAAKNKASFTGTLVLGRVVYTYTVGFSVFFSLRFLN
jgi:hypothetical protein